jgi:hypothetical protein
MPRTLPTETHRPTTLPDTMTKTFGDRLNRRLETGPVGKRAKTKGELTIGTTIAPKINHPGHSVEIGHDKAMPPEPSVTSRAIRRPGPGKKLSLLENVLDAHIHLE